MPCAVLGDGAMALATSRQSQEEVQCGGERYWGKILCESCTDRHSNFAQTIQASGSSAFKKKHAVEDMKSRNPDKRASSNSKSFMC